MFQPIDRKVGTCYSTNNYRTVLLHDRIRHDDLAAYGICCMPGCGLSQVVGTDVVQEAPRLVKLALETGNDLEHSHNVSQANKISFGALNALFSLFTVMIGV